MSKKHNSSQYSSHKTNPTNNQSVVKPTPPNPVTSAAANPDTETQRVQPEQMSLDGHEHIQHYLEECKKANLDKDDLTAVLRLSQHLRVFGLLSAVGYVNQSNAQEGKVRERTVPVWQSLLGQLLDKANPPKGRQLMEKVVELSRDNPNQYMATWRKSLVLANHWNFWARAYLEE